MKVFEHFVEFIKPPGKTCNRYFFKAYSKSKIDNFVADVLLANSIPRLNDIDRVPI